MSQEVIVEVFPERGATQELIVGTLQQLSTTHRDGLTIAYAKDAKGGGRRFNYRPEASGLTADGVLIVQAQDGGYWESAHSGRAKLDWWDAKGDGVTDDRNAINSAIQAKVPLEGGSGKKYRCDTPLDPVDFFDWKSGGSEFFFNNISSTEPAIAVYGEELDEENIDQDAIKGRNYIVSSDMVSKVSLGDMVLIRSEKPFSQGTNQRQGETKEVFRVDPQHNRIFFNEALHDTYLASDDAVIIKIKSAHCYVNTLKMTKNLTSDYASQEIGLSVRYAKNADIRAVVNNFNNINVRVQSCLKSKASVIVNNALRVAGGPQSGYGIELNSATCDSVFSVISSNCRHGQAGSATQSVSGIPHNNIIKDSIVICGRGNAAYDSHANMGSTIYDNCIAVSPVDGINHQNNTFRGAGWNIGATHVSMKNCEGVGLSHVVNFRNDAVTERLSVTNFTARDCAQFFNFVITEPNNNATGFVRDIHINGVYGNFEGRAFEFTTSLENPLESIYLSNLRFKSTTAIFIGNDFPFPDTLKIDGFDLENLKDSNGDYIVNSAFGQNYGIFFNRNQNLINIVMSNGEFRGFKKGFQHLQDNDYPMDLIDMTNVRFVDCEEHFDIRGRNNLDENNTYECLKILSIKGVFMKGSSHNNPDFGGINLQRNWNTIGTVLIDDVISLGENYVLGKALRADKIFVGKISAPDATDYIRRKDNTNLIEYLSGTESDPQRIRIHGTPESRISAGYGCMCLRRDAQQVYIKTTASGNTGWKRLALHEEIPD